MTTAKRTGRAEFRRMPDEIAVEVPIWLNLGQLRELVRVADDHDWPDQCLISHGAGGEHIRRHDIRTAQRIYIEGSDQI
jgi:hypothetical protein